MVEQVIDVLTPDEYDSNKITITDRNYLITTDLVVNFESCYLRNLFLYKESNTIVLNFASSSDGDPYEAGPKLSGTWTRSEVALTIYETDNPTNRTTFRGPAEEDQRIEEPYIWMMTADESTGLSNFIDSIDATTNLSLIINDGNTGLPPKPESAVDFLEVVNPLYNSTNNTLNWNNAQELNLKVTADHLLPADRTVMYLRRLTIGNNFGNTVVSIFIDYASSPDEPYIYGSGGGDIELPTTFQESTRFLTLFRAGTLEELVLEGPRSPTLPGLISNFLTSPYYYHYTETASVNEISSFISRHKNTDTYYIRIDDGTAPSLGSDTSTLSSYDVITGIARTLNKVVVNDRTANSVVKLAPNIPGWDIEPMTWFITSTPHIGKANPSYYDLIQEIDCTLYMYEIGEGYELGDRLTEAYLWLDESVRTITARSESSLGNSVTGFVPLELSTQNEPSVAISDEGWLTVTFSIKAIQMRNYAETPS